MQKIEWEITEDEYNKYKSMSHKDFNKIMENKIPVQWFCGYGWYGCDLIKKSDNKYYVIHTIGDTCD